MPTDDAARAVRPAFVEVRRLDWIRVVRGRIAAEELAEVSSFGTTSSSLSAWDVHLLDPSSDSRLAGFVLRRGCILLAMSPLRVVLTSRAFFLCPEPGCDGELEPLIRRLGDAAMLNSSKVPLPVVALAAILDVCRSVMAADLRDLSMAVAQLAAKLRHRKGAEEVLQQRCVRACASQTLCAPHRLMRERRPPPPSLTLLPPVRSLATVEADLNEYLDRLASVLKAVASFSDAETRHNAEARLEARALLHDVHTCVAAGGGEAACIAPHPAPRGAWA